MTLPRPPISHNTPIPNQPFEADEVYYLESNQGPLPLGNGLYIDPGTGAFTDIPPSPYCSPAYPHLPVTQPPYGCETEINTTGLTSLRGAWSSCNDIVSFPCIDSSSVVDFYETWCCCPNLVFIPRVDTSLGVDFYSTWYCCYDLDNFPELDLSKGEDFTFTWNVCESMTNFPVKNMESALTVEGAWSDCPSLTSFPAIDFPSCTNFQWTWSQCPSLTSFPLIDVSSGSNFQGSWSDCTSLTTFPPGMFDNCIDTSPYYFNLSWHNCALSQQSVDNILISIDTAGESDGIVHLDGGTSSPPGVAGLAAKASLEGKGWTVLTN